MKLTGISRSAKLALIAGIATFSVLAGAGAGWAYWTAQATSSTTLAAANLTITSSGFATTTVGNESITAAGATSLVATSSITLTNSTVTSSTQSHTLSVTFSRSAGDAALAVATTLTVWSVNSAADCTPAATPPGGSPSASWASGVTVSTPLAVGLPVTYCLRSTVGDRQGVAIAGGARSFTPQAAATLKVGNFTRATTPTSTVQTQYIYPLQQISAGYWWYVKRATTDWCWDVSGSGTTDGSLFISYACKAIGTGDTNQDFRYADPDGDGYGNFQPRNATNLRVSAASSTVSGSAVDMRTASATAATQQWQPQLVSGSGATGTYQFVNKNSGLCLSLPTVSTGVGTQVTCSGGADQRFSFTQRALIQLTSVACANIGGNGANRSVTFSWTSDWDGGPYTVQALSPTNAWTQIASASAANATSASVASPIIAPLATWAAGTYNVQILNSTGTAVGTDTITVVGASGSRYARC